ncbi:hypothetical protein K503DRAFT_765792 [Rhizopogon vinicolor AM-OR11-026]|uniref:Uncharacterized protein n=1 Tax=Rhizopogon vinicolor AM-OR11-026 TaxID=1314800 RepID=A0A1B7NFL7_9AGAM|nr:hypothetical protein K503DRAFT_765792 [Rhizopogon vinicolor AM-OR11-026]
MGNEYTTTSHMNGGALAHHYAYYTYERQDDGVNSLLQYLSSSSPYPTTPTDSLTSVVDLVPTSASADTNASIISITALPPLITAPDHTQTKFSSFHHLNFIFLSPIFAVLGIFLGVASSYLWFKFHPLRPDTGSGACGLRRRGNGRSSGNNLELGAVHVPEPDVDVDSNRAHLNRNEGTEDATPFAVGTTSQSTVHGTRYPLSMHIHEPHASDTTEIKPLPTPFLADATQSDSFWNEGSDHDDSFTWTHLPLSSSGTSDAGWADAGAPQRSMFDMILSHVDGMQYAAIRIHDPSYDAPWGKEQSCVRYLALD